MSGVITHNIACPECILKKVEVPIRQTQGQFYYYCENGHRFHDTEQLMSLAPPALSRPLAKKVRPPDQNSVELRLSVPSKLKEILDQRFGERLSPTLVSVLIALCEPGAFIVRQEDVGRLSEQFGRPIKHGADIVGAAYELKSERNRLTGELERLQGASAPTATPGVSASSNGKIPCMVNLDPEIVKLLSDKARFRGISMQELIEQTTDYGVRNGWF